MACTKGTVSWFCLYPDKCTSKGCSSDCCDNGNCANSCHQTTVTHGGCCNTSATASGLWYAWPSACAAFTRNCNSYNSFTLNCTSYYAAKRADTGPACSLGRTADLTQALFTLFKPLHSGIITNMIVTDNTGCC
jgi:hypothetical protein